MPVSPYHYLNETCRLLVREFPTSILDVGVGHGKWGFLARDTLEAFVGTRYFKRDWTIRLDGVEIFAAYRNPVWDYAYDRVWIGDACEIVPRLDAYDVILALEVIEHVEKAAAMRLVQEMVHRAVRGLVLAFPDAESPEALAKDESYGNPHERHRSLWTVADLEPYEYEVLSPQHVFVRDPGKRRLRAVDVPEGASGPWVVREAPKGFYCPANPFLVLTQAGGGFRLAFSGRRVHVYFFRHGYCGRAEMRVDGVAVAEVPMSGPSPAVYGCWRSERLTPGEHVLEVRAMPDPTSGNAEVWLDDLIVEA